MRKVSAAVDISEAAVKLWIKTGDLTTPRRSMPFDSRARPANRSRISSSSMTANRKRAAKRKGLMSERPPRRASPSDSQVPPAHTISAAAKNEAPNAQTPFLMRSARASASWRLMEDLLPRCSVENLDLADSDEPRKSHNRERLNFDGKEDWLCRANRAMCVSLERFISAPKEDHTWTLRLTRGSRDTRRTPHEAAIAGSGPTGSARCFRSWSGGRYPRAAHIFRTRVCGNSPSRSIWSICLMLCSMNSQKKQRASSRG
jgi:hypothetical protein